MRSEPQEEVGNQEERLRVLEGEIRRLRAEKAQLEERLAIQQEKLVDLSVRLSGEFVMLHSLLEFSKAVSTSLDKKELLSGALELLRRAFSLQHVCFFSMAPDGKHLSLEASSIGHLLRVTGERLQIAGSFAESAMVSGQTTVLSGQVVLEDPFCRQYVPAMASALCAPITLRGRLRGIMVAFGEAAGSFENRDIHVLAAAAGHLAIALENCELHERIQYQALTDPLTGLTNRRVLGERLAAEIARANRYSRPLSVLMIDIDHFKRLNDAFGHQFGDKVLKSLASLLLQELRREDLCARYGGEEFVVVLPEAELGTACDVAERLRVAVEQLRLPPDGGDGKQITISIGIADLPSGSSDGEALIDRADRAMYEAKSRGRNQVCAA